MTGWWVAAVLLVGTAAFLVVRRRLFVAVTVNGMSMAPTFSGGERIMVRRKGFKRLRRGDVVVVRYRPPRPAGPHGPYPGVDGMWLVKRVTALAGDPLPAEVAEAAGLPAGSPIPDGRFVVLGDNSEGSLDSRTCGLFDANSLLGIMTARQRQP